MRINICAAVPLALFAVALRAPDVSSQARQNAPAADRAKVAQVVGKADRRTSKSPEQWTALASNDLVAPDSAVRTSDNSAVLLALPDKHVIRIGENTTLEMKSLGQGGNYSFSLVQGQIWSFVDKASKPARYEVETPSTILGVSGTLFSVAHNPSDNESDVSVEEGEVHLRQGRVDKTVGIGYQMRVLPNRLRNVVAHPHTKATAAMWKSVHEREAWMKPGGALVLNHQIDERARALREERSKEKAAGGRGRGRGRGHGRGPNPV